MKEIMAQLAKKERARAEHTPGPWEVRGCNPAWAFEHIPGKARLIGREVSIRGPGFEPETCGQAASDALLIAAAPELLVALAEVIQYADNVACHASGAMDRAIAAIAKAEGRD